MTVEKPKPKQLLRPITTGANSMMNQSQFLAITVPLKSKLPVASRFRRDANRVARESSKRKMSGIN